MKKIFYKYYSALLLSLMIVVWSYFLLNVNKTHALEVSFLDVGQGDAILIEAPPGQNILIDGGPDSTILRRLGEELPFWERTIDLMILTHPHDDHVTGLIDVLNRYKVNKILYTGVEHNSPNYQAWQEIIGRRNIPAQIVNKQQEIILGENCVLKIFSPDLKSENLNNTSIVSKLNCAGKSFLFTGDLEEDGEMKILTADLEAQILKIGHHGSSSSTSLDFLNVVNPQQAIVSVGTQNKFGHPSTRTLNRLERGGIEVFRTDLVGTVKMK